MSSLNWRSIGRVLRRLTGVDVRHNERMRSFYARSDRLVEEQFSADLEEELVLLLEGLGLRKDDWGW